MRTGTAVEVSSRAEELGYVQAQFEGTDPEAVIEVTAAAYPIIANLQAKTFAPFVTKVAELVIKDRGAKYTADLAKSVDLGLDWFLSLSPEKVKDSTGAVRDAFKGLSPDTCALVPLPPLTARSELAALPPLTVRAVDGLCNRLRVVLSYAAVARRPGRRLLDHGPLRSIQRYTGSPRCARKKTSGRDRRQR